MSTERFLPTPEEIILEKGLYEKIDLGEERDWHIAEEILDLEFFNGAIRTYCPDCEQESVFRTNQLRDGSLRSLTTLHFAHHYRGDSSVAHACNSISELQHFIQRWDKYAFANKTFTLEFYCTHNHNHRIFYTFNIKNHVLRKIGQFPSIADSMETELKDYKKSLEKELDKEKSQEFSKAIGLFSHGVGIGSFVYLRRIFEAFVFQAKDEAVKKGDITDEEFKSKRMAEKIELLKDYLPEVIVEHKTLYGVVSKGIHELSEDECKKYFSVIKDGIELILDEKIAKRKAQEKKNKFAKGIAKAHQELKI